MAIKRSDYALGTKDTPYPEIAGAATVHRFAMAVAANIVAGDILELAIIPAGTRPIDLVIDVDSLDAGAGLVFDVGIMSGEVGDPDAARTCGAEFFAASTLGQDGGVARPSLASAYRVSKANVARSIGIKVTTAAATAQAGSIGITLTVAAV
jgi:hypothetical protein